MANKEMDSALQSAKDSLTKFTCKFSTPFTYEGKTYESLTFDFGKLTGNDSAAIEEEMMAQGKNVVVPTLSGGFLIRMACRACTERIGTDTMGAMPIREYNKIRGAARNFLLLTEL